jgi:hypothetical protein
MPDVVEQAKSGRAKCRGCGEKIAKDELRFGEAVPNPYDDEEGATTLHWFHLTCGAHKRAEKVRDALAEFDGDVPDRASLDAIIELGVRNPKLALVRGAERAPSGRARCRECRELIEKDAWRLVIDVEDEGMTMATKYFVHAGCAAAHVGGEGLLDKIRRSGSGESDLEESDLADLAAAL